MKHKVPMRNDACIGRGDYLRTAPVLAGTYLNALVPVGIVMALLGYVVGTGGGLLVANIMSGDMPLFWKISE